MLVETENYADNLTAERIRRVTRGVPKAKDEALKNGLDGSFTFCELGEALDLDRFFDGKSAPTYEQVARYVIYTATGQSVSHVPKERRKDWFVGEAGGYRKRRRFRDRSHGGEAGNCDRSEPGPPCAHSPDAGCRAKSLAGSAYFRRYAGQAS